MDLLFRQIISRPEGPPALFLKGFTREKKEGVNKRLPFTNCKISIFYHQQNLQFCPANKIKYNMKKHNRQHCCPLCTVKLKHDVTATKLYAFALLIFCFILQLTDYSACIFGVDIRINIINVILRFQATE